MQSRRDAKTETIPFGFADSQICGKRGPWIRGDAGGPRLSDLGRRFSVHGDSNSHGELRQLLKVKITEIVI
jgi:hypothetical protein